LESHSRLFGRHSQTLESHSSHSQWYSQPGLTPARLSHPHLPKIIKNNF
jgi:hypothetical protein